MSFERLFESLRDLPVAEIAVDVAQSVMSGKVTTLFSATGSGKTLYQTAKLADLCGEQVLVLVPRRFLAINAAETVAELAGCEVGTCVGYAVGAQSGDRSSYNSDTKLLFATNGYAIASGLIHTAMRIVLDEVHETSMDLSIIRALLHRRIQNGEAVELLEMSATMDERQQAAYWSTIAQTKVFTIDGRTFDCEIRHRPAGRPAEEVMALIEEGRQGILVFRPGVGEVKETAEEIQRLAEAASLSIEVSQIYGDMSYLDRRNATATPQDGVVKVLVGTNVIESGANIPWLDAGVSCGTGKENSVRIETGATYLQLIDLPRWRLQQQEGRVKRFRPGVFVLCAPLSHQERQQASRPEIERLALTDLVMHCSSFGLRTHELTFDYAPNPMMVMEAEQKLQRLGLINEECQLTSAGQFISGLSVGPETGAMLWHARQVGCLGAMLPLCAVIEVGGLRKDFRFGHSLDHASDYLDSLLALRETLVTFGKTRREYMEDHNIGFKRFDAAGDVLRHLERRLEVKADFNLERHIGLLRQCLVASSLDKLFTQVGFRGELASVKNRLTVYRIGQGSVVNYIRPGIFVLGDLRVIKPKDPRKLPFTVVEKVTTFTLDDLKAVAKIRPEILTEERFLDFSVQYTNYMLFGQYLIQQERAHTLEDEYYPPSYGYGSQLRRY